jgi:hypothetical protein
MTEKQLYTVNVRRMHHGRLFIRATSKAEARALAHALCQDAYPEGTVLTKEHVYSINVYPNSQSRWAKKPGVDGSLWEVETTTPEPTSPQESIRYQNIEKMRARIENIRHRRERHREEHVYTPEGITPAAIRTNTG